jgi:hypothetical protein
MNKSLSENLHKAKNNKWNEYYTQLTDIEKELKKYKKQFKNKIVLCNCDDPTISNFFHYFSYSFEELGLKKLITTCYKSEEINLFSQRVSNKAIYLEYFGDKNGDRIPNPEEIGIKHLKSDGDFRSEECVELLKEADIIVTNPPFTLFREYIEQLTNFKKKFLIMGHQGAIGYKETFPLIQNGKIWLGYNNGGTKWFRVNNDYDIKTISRKKIVDGKKYFSMGNVVWYTNLNVSKRNEEIILFKKYNKKDYPKYDNYDAIDVSKVSEIPKDFDGIMGVPVTFLDKHNPNQFEILGLSQKYGYGLESKKFYNDYVEIRSDGSKTGSSGKKTNGNPVMKGMPKKGNYFSNGKRVVHSLYTRIFIRKI